ncbi:MAG TPA: aminoacyl-tRNA deacylase [Mesotoga infera]|uniref:Cys-tRNA(Pro)/Cys-tRNA(Cys) deacylase n=1 Tax=Mesotoga infera TaxID=1236046 RepID=A0A7C1CUI0_9BACT|nr:aminoacyl-tRNA deacylase [Mesotoga infera]
MKGKKTRRTNATRILDGLGIKYEVLEYEVDENDLGAENVALKLGLSVSQTVKTIVLKGDRSGVFVCCLRGHREIDMKKLPEVTGDRNIETVPAERLLSLTGYVRGGVSPLGMKKNLRILIDSDVVNEDSVSMSAGKRGLQLWLRPSELVYATEGEVASFSKEKR